MIAIIIEALRNAVLITGLVVVMMMMIESLNIESKGLIFKGLKKTRTGQVVIGALLGSIPGCMGGFATVSLYTHRMLSFGALVAMAGSAVGLGNLWRFPYLVGENGGAAFIIVYILMSFLICLPIFISEFVMGRRSQKNAYSAFRDLSGGSRWR